MPVRVHADAPDLQSAWCHRVVGPAARVDTGLSNPGRSRWFSAATNGNALFIGDYNGVAVGADGRTWSLWTDQRNIVATPPSPSRNHGQHAVGATPSLPPPPPF